MSSIYRDRIFLKQAALIFYMRPPRSVSTTYGIELTATGRWVEADPKLGVAFFSFRLIGRRLRTFNKGMNNLESCLFLIKHILGNKVAIQQNPSIPIQISGDTHPLAFFPMFETPES